MRHWPVSSRNTWRQQRLVASAAVAAAAGTAGRHTGPAARTEGLRIAAAAAGTDSQFAVGTVCVCICAFVCVVMHHSWMMSSFCAAAIQRVALLTIATLALSVCVYVCVCVCGHSLMMSSHCAAAIQRVALLTIASLALTHHFSLSLSLFLSANQHYAAVCVCLAADSPQARRKQAHAHTKPDSLAGKHTWAEHTQAARTRILARAHMLVVHRSSSVHPQQQVQVQVQVQEGVLMMAL